MLARINAFVLPSYEFRFRTSHNRNQYVGVLPSPVFKIEFVFAANANFKMGRADTAMTLHVRELCWAVMTRNQRDNRPAQLDNACRTVLPLTHSKQTFGPPPARQKFGRTAKLSFCRSSPLALTAFGACSKETPNVCVARHF